MTGFPHLLHGGGEEIVGKKEASREMMHVWSV